VLETALLKFLVDGKDVDRWTTKWNNQLVVVPYVEDRDKFNLLEPEAFKRTYPKTYEYFTNEKVLTKMADASPDRKKILEDLKQALGATDYTELSALLKDAKKIGALKGDLWWYRYVYRKNIESIGKPKVIVATTSVENRFSGDPEGALVPHNVRVNSLLIPKKHLHYVLGLLNSRPAAYYLNHVSNLKKGKRLNTSDSHWPVSRSGFPKTPLEGRTLPMSPRK
jgi:hypothetical protein